ncbi:MAG: DapH/DapD/GlmU-related protein [Planctomycetota bacterium]
MAKALVVFGDRTAAEIAESAKEACAEDFATIQTHYFNPTTFGEFATGMEADFDSVHFLSAVTDIDLKSAMISAAASRGWSSQSVIHPSAVLSKSSSVGAGAFVGPLAVISTNATIGAHSIIHLHASVGHDCSLGEMAAVLPGARVSGNVQMGDRCLIGSNAFVSAGVEIGDDCHIDALTYVRDNLEAGHLASVRAKYPVRRIHLSKGLQ